MERRIVGFHLDDARDWVAELECGHDQHVRHDPPWTNRPWVVTPEGRAKVLGQVLNCRKCDQGAPRDRGTMAASELPGTGHRMSTALLVIDVQHALCSGDYAAFEIDRVIDNINAVAAKARAAGATVVFIQHEEDGPLRFDTEGWQLAVGLAASPDDPRVRKTACDSFHQTGLQALLQQRGITRLVVCGLQTDFCVDTTVRRALALGYDVTLVADAHSTLANDVLSAAQIIAHHNATLSNLTSFGPRVEVTPARDLRIGA